jgi:anti-anti-sigma factor
MSMKLTTRDVSGVTIVDLSGKITLGEGGMTLRDEVHKLLAAGSKKIVLNLADVNYIDSSGLAGKRVYGSKERWRRVEAAEPDQQSARSACDYEAGHGV